MGWVVLLGSTVITAYCSKLLNFPSETNLDPVRVTTFWFRNRTWLLVRMAVPGRKDGCGDARRTEVHFTGLLPTPGTTFSNAQLEHREEFPALAGGHSGEILAGLSDTHMTAR